MALWREHVRPLLSGLPSPRGLLPLLAGLLVWQIVQGGPSPYFPAPSEWWDAAVRLWSGSRLLQEFLWTAWGFLQGLALAIAVGGAVGILIGASRLLARALKPVLEFMRAIPPPAIVPVAGLLIGYNEPMKLTVVTLAALWPILLNTSSAVAQIHPVLTEVSRSFRLTQWEKIRRITLPSVVPALLLGIRVAIPLTIVVTLLVEMLTSLPGMGSLMIRSQRNFQSSEVYALLVLVGLFGFAVNNVFLMIEGLIMRRWPPRATLTG